MLSALLQCNPIPAQHSSGNSWSSKAAASCKLLAVSHSSTVYMRVVSASPAIAVVATR